MISRFGKRFGSDKGHYPVKPGIVGALDVGSTKVACFIARADGTGNTGQRNLRVLGIGHQISRGVRAGTVYRRIKVESVHGIEAERSADCNAVGQAPTAGLRNVGR